MAYADYEHCPGCDGKVIYTANVEVPDDVVCWHQTCLDTAFAEARGSGTPKKAADSGIEIYDAVLPQWPAQPWAPFPNRIPRR